MNNYLKFMKNEKFEKKENESKEDALRRTESMLDRIKEIVLRRQNVNKKSCETIEKRVSKLRGKPRTEDVKKQISISNSKPILQFDLNGNKISYFNSIKEAKEKTGIKTIIDNLSGRQKTAGGYKWGYADDYELIPFKVFDLEIYRKKVA